VIPIDPDTHLLRAMRAGAAGLKAGKILNVYPEGQRSFDGELREFKAGAAILARELKLPIIPVALDGAFRVWPRHSWRFRLAKIRIHFGQPILPEEITASDDETAYDQLTTTLRQRIQHLLDDMRASARS
jgi:1-acyl-sn-glycerol-3-phosphate acyltransferase